MDLAERSNPLFDVGQGCFERRSPVWTGRPLRKDALLLQFERLQFSADDGLLSCIGQVLGVGGLFLMPIGNLIFY